MAGYFFKKDLRLFALPLPRLGDGISMKKRIAAALTTVLLVFLVSVSSPSAPSESAVDDCSCTAPDGSCSASITCHGGCEQWCGPGGDCFAQCSGFLQILGMETTVQMRNAKYPQLVAELARISGRDLAFSSYEPDIVFNAEYKRALLWDVLDTLSDRGKVQIAGQDFEKLKRIRRVLVSGGKLSLCVRGTPVNIFVNDLSSLTGLSLHIVDGRPMSTVNVKLHDVTLNEILLKVSEQTETKIVEAGVDNARQ